MVLCVKRSSGESGLVYWIRKQYYQTVERLSSIETIQNYTGFGLYDRKVVDLARSFNDPYPYFRGIIAEIGLPNKRLYFDQPARKRGITKNNWYTLYDIAMLGIISTSKVPLRLAVFAGFAGSAFSFFMALLYLILKLIFWKTFSVGVAPMLIGIFFLMSIQMVFMGFIGEYVGSHLHQDPATPLRRRTRTPQLRIPTRPRTSHALVVAGVSLRPLRPRVFLCALFSSTFYPLPSASRSTA